MNTKCLSIILLLLTNAGCSGSACGPGPCQSDPKDECIKLAKLIQNHVKVGMSVKEVYAIVGDSLYTKSQISEPFIVKKFVHNGPSINFYDQTPFDGVNVYVVKDFDSGLSACKEMQGLWEE